MKKRISIGRIVGVLLGLGNGFDHLRSKQLGITHTHRDMPQAFGRRRPDTGNRGQTCFRIMRGIAAPGWLTCEPTAVGTAIAHKKTERAKHFATSARHLASSL